MQLSKYAFTTSRRKLTIRKSPKSFDTLVTVENEVENSRSGMSSDTLLRSKSGVSSVVVVIGGALVVAPDEELACGQKTHTQKIVI